MGDAELGLASPCVGGSEWCRRVLAGVLSLDPLPLVLLPRAEPQESWGAAWHPLCPGTTLAWSSERVSSLFLLGRAAHW